MQLSACDHLKDFFARKMRMSHVYQPPMLKTLIERGGFATLGEIALSFLVHDESQAGPQVFAGGDASISIPALSVDLPLIDLYRGLGSTDPATLRIRHREARANTAGRLHAMQTKPRRQFRELVRSRGLEPPRVAPLAPQASASTNSATTAGMRAGRKASRRSDGGGCNKSPHAEQGPAPIEEDTLPHSFQTHRNAPSLQGRIWVPKNAARFLGCVPHASPYRMTLRGAPQRAQAGES
jgi:hypothetical protein